MNNPERARELLQQAARLTREAAGEISFGSEKCECCGLTKHEPLENYRLTNEIEAAYQKLLKLADKANLKARKR